MTMGMMSVILHKYVAPFAAGMSVAAATVAGNAVAAAVLVTLAGLFAYASLPPGGRIISRLVETSS